MQEFVRIGYYVNNDYLDEELRENPPADAIIDKYALGQHLRSFLERFVRAKRIHPSRSCR